MPRSLLALAAVLPACAAEPAPIDPMLVTPSSQHATHDMVAEASATCDGTTTTIRVELRDPADDASIDLVDGDQLVARIGGARVGMAQELYQDVRIGGTRARYELVLGVTDPGNVVIELQRADGSLATVTVPVPPAFDVASAPPADIKLYDHVAFSVRPAPGAAQLGLATFEATALLPSNLLVDAFGAGSFVAGEAGGSLDQAAVGKLDLALVSQGTYDSALGNAPGQHPRGIQVRSVNVQLWP